MHDYNPSTVESKWQKKWEEAHAYDFDLKKAKDPYYSMVMFPYPSGAKLHVGHWFQYSIPDSFSRFMKMKGKDVFHPMGFDAFGLPAENYAIKTGVPPAESTAKNVEVMIDQFKRMGTMFDWRYCLNTSTPQYYRWTQWLFLQMYKHKLAYKKLGNVNYCPKDQTVLANEQVWEGKCERCGSEVIQKPLDQWFWQITKYSQKLLDNLDDLDWPEKTKLMQKNWIGRSEGAEVIFAIDGSTEKIKVFTTRPDTLFGVTYVALSPEHPLVDIITQKKHLGAVTAYRERARKQTELQREQTKVKTGEPTGSFAVHPVTKEKIPVWIADYVLMNYGTGAVMAVPGHDERDFEFAKNYKLPVVEVVAGGDVTAAAFTGEGTAANSDFLNGLKTHEAKKKMIAWLEDEDCGRGVITFRLRDWLVSRQRYWGAPIPIVYDPQGNPHPVPEEHLPWILPTDVEFKPTGKSPLTESKEFIERTEKIFGKGWRPEFDTMDTFVCSSFYYLRYLMASCHPELAKDDMTPGHGSQAHHDTDFVDKKLEKKWLPVHMYIGGPEHACMHLIYARFVMMALNDFGFVSNEEPFQKLVHQGLITNKGAKMSKSKGNVISPDSFVERHGSDAFRMYLMFMGPFTEGGDWSDTGIKGIDRFVQRVWRTFGANPQRGSPALSRVEGSTRNSPPDDKPVTVALHTAIKKITDSMNKMHFNTAISALMEFMNAVEGKSFSEETAKTFAQLLAPLAPHLSEELWEVLGGKGFVIDQIWPVHDPKMLVTDTMIIVVQVNGKVRGQVEMATDAPEKEIVAAAKADPHVQKFLEGKQPKKEIYVKGKLVSLVL